MKQILLVLLCMGLCVEANGATASISSKPLPGAHLQASIRTTPINIPPQPDSNSKVQPGTAVKVNVIVKNTGDKSSHSGDVFVRFAFLKPLEGESRSILFETERKHLPPIEPGKEVEITFTKIHQWPSVFDYIRDDWHMRQYEALVDIQGKQQVIGRAAVSVSAKYYNGPTNEIPAEVPQL